MRRFKFDGRDARQFVLDLMKTGNGKVPRDIPTQMIPAAALEPDSAAAREPRRASRVPVPEDDEEDSEEDEGDEIRAGDFRFKCLFDEDQWWCQKFDLSSLEVLNEKPLPMLQTKNGRTKGLGYYQFKREDGDIVVWAGTKATTHRLDDLFQEEEEDDVENGEDGGDTPDYTSKGKRPVGAEAAEGDSEPALKKARQTQTAKDLAPGVSAAPAMLRGMKAAEKNKPGPQCLAENQTC